jgi:sporulation integral membrane protein YtvI
MEKSYTLDLKKLKKLLGIIVGMVIGIVVIYKSITYIAPFILALILSLLMEPIIKFLVNKAKIPRKASVALSIVIILGVIGFVITTIIIKFVQQIRGLLSNVPHFVGQTYDTINGLSSKDISPEYLDLYTQIMQNINGILDNVISNVAKITDVILKGAFNTASSFPEILLFIIATIMSTYFIASYRENINKWASTQLPEKWYVNICSIKNNVFGSIGKLIRAYIIIVSITFTELFIGFSIIGIDHTLVLAIIVSIVDLLPVLGTGVIIMPWAVYQLLVGELFTGVSLIVLWALILIIRQMIEPKIIGSQIGVNPLLTLMGIYVGFKLIGAAGLILGPITVVILKAILSVCIKERNIKELLLKPNE